MRELIDELYVTRRRLDKREGRKFTTYADLTTEAFELLLQQTPTTGPQHTVSPNKAIQGI
jgi:hypothetical protein